QHCHSISYSFSEEQDLLLWLPGTVWLLEVFFRKITTDKSSRNTCLSSSKQCINQIIVSLKIRRVFLYFFQKRCSFIRIYRPFSCKLKLSLSSQEIWMSNTCWIFFLELL